jgi:hypothetical protein
MSSGTTTSAAGRLADLCLNQIVELLDKHQEVVGGGGKLEVELEQRVSGVWCMSNIGFSWKKRV